MTGELAKELRHAIELTAATADLPDTGVQVSDHRGGWKGLNGSRVGYPRSGQGDGSRGRGGHCLD